MNILYTLLTIIYTEVKSMIYTFDPCIPSRSQSLRCIPFTRHRPAHTLSSWNRWRFMRSTHHLPDKHLLFFRLLISVFSLPLHPFFCCFHKLLDIDIPLCQSRKECVYRTLAKLCSRKQKVGRNESLTLRIAMNTT